jgi:hypothetical protein
MVLPPTGIVSVRVTDASGQPLSLGVCTLGTKGDKAGSGLLAASHQPIIDGKSEHLFVGLGLKLELTAIKFLRERPADMTTKEFAGPARLDERVNVEITLRSANTHLWVRAVDKDGLPIVQRDVDINYESEERAHSTQHWNSSTRTNDSGLLEFPAPSQTEYKKKLTVRVQSKLLSGKVIKGQSVFWIDPSAANDVLGDVTLLESTAFAAGIVKGSHGAPVSGTRITLFEMKTPRFDPQGEPYRESVYLEKDVYSDSKGRFEIHADLPQGKYLFSHADPRFAVSPAQPFSKGDTNLTIVVEKSAQVKGRILVDHEDSLRSLSIEITQPAVGPTFHESFPCRGGKFEVYGLRAGPAIVTVSVGDSRSYLGDSDLTNLGSTPRPGVLKLHERTVNLGMADEVTEKPDLDIDLRGRLKPIRLDAVAMRDGKREFVRISASDSAGRKISSSEFEETQLVLVDGHPLSITVSCDGFESQTLTDVDADVVITLSRIK